MSSIWSRSVSGNLPATFTHRPQVHVHEAEARGFANTSADHYDLVQVALLDSFGVASAGLYGLSESYLYTVEALQTYLSRLAPDGILAVTRWLSLPPRDALKLFATAVVALEKDEVSNPAARLVMIRGWKTVTVLVKNSDFTPGEIEAVKEFCRKRSFDVAYYPGMAADEANRYNLLAQPYFFEGAMALLGPQRQDFIERYKFYIEPATDDRPYFFRFFKWSAAAELLSLREQGGMPLLDWSYPLLVATLIQAFVASVLLILVPLGRISGPPCFAHRAGCAVLSRHRPGIHVHGNRLHPEICAFSRPSLVCGGSCVMRIPGFRRCWKLAGWAMAEYKDPQQLPAGGYKRHGSHRPNLSRDPATDFRGAYAPAGHRENRHFYCADRAIGDMHGNAFSDRHHEAGERSARQHPLGMGNQWLCLGSRRGPRDAPRYPPGLCRGYYPGRPDLRLGCNCPAQLWRFCLS